MCSLLSGWAAPKEGQINDGLSMSDHWWAVSGTGQSPFLSLHKQRRTSCLFLFFGNGRRSFSPREREAFLRGVAPTTGPRVPAACGGHRPLWPHCPNPQGHFLVLSQGRAHVWTLRFFTAPHQLGRGYGGLGQAHEAHGPRCWRDGRHYSPILSSLDHSYHGAESSWAGA